MGTCPWSGGRGGAGTAIGEGWFSQKEVMQGAFSDLLLRCPCPQSGSGVSSGIPNNQGFLTTPTTLYDDNEDSLLNCPIISAITSQPLESGVICHQSIYPQGLAHGRLFMGEGSLCGP